MGIHGGLERTTRSDPAITIICPALNEAATIGPLCAAIRSLPTPVELLVVDDGSADDTAQRARDAGATVIEHGVTRGNGAAVKTGLTHARGEWIVLIDGDGQHDPQAIPLLLEQLADGAHLVVAARTHYRRSGVLRTIGNRVLARLASRATGTRIPDLTSGFRAFRREHVLPLVPLLPEGFSTPTTTTLGFLRRGLDVRFVPVQPPVALPMRRTHTRLIRDGVRFVTIVARIAARPPKTALPAASVLATVKEQ
jgi:glycosyltransferase involved in cell wall biosynthesis